MKNVLGVPSARVLSSCDARAFSTRATTSMTRQPRPIATIAAAVSDPGRATAATPWRNHRHVAQADYPSTVQSDNPVAFYRTSSQTVWEAARDRSWLWDQRRRLFQNRPRFPVREERLRVIARYSLKDARWKKGAK